MEQFRQSDNMALLRVLLIEANDRDAQRLLEALRNGGHVVYSRQAGTGDEVAEALRAERWDVILLSTSLADLTAADAVDLIGELAADVPVVLTVERGSKTFPLELLEAGVSDFVFKSNPTRLLAVIERECGRAHLRREAGLSGALAEPKRRCDLGQARFFQLATNTPECYWLVDAKTQRVTYVNKAYEQIWGRYVEALYADNQDWLRYVHEDDREAFAEALKQNRQGGMDMQIRVERPGDSVRWLHVRNFPVRDEEGKVISIGGVATDVTSQVAEQWKIPYFAHYDALTALPNQMMFYDRARQLIALAKRKRIPLGLMLVDIDRFREVNQTLGHISGDEMLRQVAGRLSGSLRESDVLGRLGGDVFAILLPDVANEEQAAIVARRIVDTLIMPIRVEGQDVFATASVGIAFYSRDGKDAHELVTNAEIAVAHAKAHGRNNYLAYSADMHNGIRERLILETDLRNAALRNEFVLYYQPKASCANGHITGAEALLRWNNPRRGIVSPDQFIPLLEETGLIVTVGRWVLEEACRQLKAWQDEGIALPSVSVNLSARQLQSDSLLKDIADTLASSGLRPGCLDLEITESMLMQNADTAIRTLSGLKKMGVTISLDDFGTGYSSLAYLKRFPIDAVKVDRSFVRDIAADSDDASITRAVITMAHHLKLKVVAEGVETAAQLALLISHHCDIIQGYFFSRPLPAEGLKTLLLADTRLPPNLLNSGTRNPMVLFVGIEGFDGVLEQLQRDGHRVCHVQYIDSAIQWLSGNLVDVLVCAAPSGHFDPLPVIEKAIATQPDCERILLADSKQWNRRSVAKLSSGGLVQRVIHLPIEPETLRQAVEEALGRRQISEEFSRLSHEVEVVERQLMRIEDERQRLEAENRELHAQETHAHRLLQEVMAELPWPVLGVDEYGMLALINERALELLAARGIAPGMPLKELLPEVGDFSGVCSLKAGKSTYTGRWRACDFGGNRIGHLLVLEET